MGIEIERKFLVTSDEWRSRVHASSRMSQGYLNDPLAVASGRELCSVRIRVAGDRAFLNFKSREVGPSRQEFEYPIPVDDAKALLALSCGGLIDKTRHYVKHQGHLWEVDEFLGENEGLVVAEIELDQLDEVFALPTWAGREVTELTRYYNLALAEHPYTRWTDQEKV